jgi:hypothetical protein
MKHKNPMAQDYILKGRLKGEICRGWKRWWSSLIDGRHCLHLEKAEVVT